MKKHMLENGVHKISMPLLGAGLDKLDWTKVKEIVLDVFSDTEIDITVYKWEKGNEAIKKAKQESK